MKEEIYRRVISSILDVIADDVSNRTKIKNIKLIIQDAILDLETQI